MAVDYFHRLIVRGRRRQVAGLRRRLARTWSRRIGRQTFTEQLPFSFAALYDIAPAASRVEREVPGEPYDVRVWPIAQGDRGPAELRYQLHTREVDLFGFLRPLSRACPSLTFVLSTLYLDDGEFASFHARRGRVKQWWLPALRHEAHWDRARRKFRLAGDDVYEDDDATLLRRGRDERRGTRPLEPGLCPPRSPAAATVVEPPSCSGLRNGARVGRYRNQQTASRGSQAWCDHSCHRVAIR